MVIINKETSPIADEGILLGKQGENNARQIVFDLTWLIETYGEGTAQLVHQRSKDSAPYAVTTAQSGNTLTWTVTNIDTAYDRWGNAELRWVVGDTLAKTLTYKTMCIRSMTADSQIPDPYQSWYDALIEYIDENSISPEDLADAIEEYIEEHPIDVPVTSVNSKTGDVVLDAEDVGAIAMSDLQSAVNTALAQAKASGEFDGADGGRVRVSYSPCVSVIRSTVYNNFGAFFI